MKIRFHLPILIIGLFLFPSHSLVAQKSLRQSKEAKTAKEFASEFYKKAENLMGQKKYHEAIESYTAAIGLDPNAPGAYLGRGQAKFLLEDLRGAIRDYDKAISIYSSWGPEKPKEKASNDGSVSIQDFERIQRERTAKLQAEDEIGGIYLRRGLAKEMLGDKVGACKDFREAYQWDRLGILDWKSFSKVCNEESVKPRTTPDASKAQRQSVSSGLEGTRWQAIHPGEIYSPLLERSLSRQFFCSFEKQGRIICSVIATASSKIIYVPKYDVNRRRIEPKPELLPSMTFPAENRVGTYTQNGNSIHIELSAYEIEATVEGDNMNGGITFKLESSQKARWIAKKIAGENE
jgi:hypothetical protein